MSNGPGWAGPNLPPGRAGPGSGGGNWCPPRADSPGLVGPVDGQGWTDAVDGPVDGPGRAFGGESKILKFKLN